MVTYRYETVLVGGVSDGDPGAVRSRVRVRSLGSLNFLIGNSEILYESSFFRDDFIASFIAKTAIKNIRAVY